MIRGTLLTDGRSDRVLVYVLRWLFARRNLKAEVRWADLSVLAQPPGGLAARAGKALDLHPADILFVHRDAERDPAADRRREIADAVAARHVAVVPVRMTEAWFLFDELALRTAADNPNGNALLNLPSLERVETLPEPKAILHEALLDATGMPHHRRRRLRTKDMFHRLAELIDDFSPLRQLSAFQALEGDLDAALAEIRTRT